MDSMRAESERILRRLDDIRYKLHQETDVSYIASNDIIKTVALSNEITNDIKEVLIILQTTMVTEFTEAKISNYKINIEIVEAAQEVLKLQNTLITNLASRDCAVKPNKPTSAFNILKEYKGVISIGSLILLIWILMVSNQEATMQVFEYIPKLLKGIL